MGKIVKSAFACLVALILAGCASSDHNDFISNNTISGTVRVTSSTNLSTQLRVPAVAAAIGGLTPAGQGITVELVRLDNQGNVIEVIATTTTDLLGNYTFAGNNIPAPDSTLAVRVVNGPSTNMRALVSGNEVDISPASESLIEKILESASLNLSTFTTQEVTALGNLLLGLGIDVGSLSFDEAVTAILDASDTVLSTLINGYSAAGASTILEDHFYNSVSTLSTLALGTPTGIGLSTGFGGGAFDPTNALMNGSQEAFIAPIFHDLSAVTQSGPGGSRSLEGYTYVINPNGQLIVWDPDGNADLGLVTADAGIMIYPETVNTPVNGPPYAALSRGLHIATIGNRTISNPSVPRIIYSNAQLDLAATGTSYHLLRLSQTLSGPGVNAITIATASGDVSFNSTDALDIGGGGIYASFAANTLDTATLDLNLATDTVAGAAGTASLGGLSGGYYFVDPFTGNLTARDNDTDYPYVGVGYVTESGELFTLVQTPDDNGSQATDDGTGTHELAVAIRHTPSQVNLSPGTYSVLQYAYYLSGDGTASAAANGRKVGALLLDSDGTTVTGGSLLSNLASMDINAARLADINALSTAQSSTPETVTGTIAVPDVNGGLTLTLTIGNQTVTGTGAVTEDGDLIIAVVTIADDTPTDIGRGLLFLQRQPD